MNQPTKEEITQKINSFLIGISTREDIYKWAYSFIVNDDFDIDDIEAWNYLVDISMIDEMIYPYIYLYSIEDISNMKKPIGNPIGFILDVLF